jgi:hypothetical protein
MGESGRNFWRCEAIQRDKSLEALSNERMKEHAVGEKIKFTLSPSAKAHLVKILSNWVESTSQKGLVPILSFSGGGRMEKDGKILWEYRGPEFLIAGQRPEALRGGKYYDLLGFSVWIQDFEQRLLEGQVLTTIKIGNSNDYELFVLANAPDNYLETALPKRCCCRSSNDSEIKDE